MRILPLVLLALVATGSVSSAFAMQCTATLKDATNMGTKLTYADVHFERKVAINPDYAFTVHTVQTGPGMTHEFIQVEDAQSILYCDQSQILRKDRRTRERNYVGVETVCDRISVLCTF